MPLVYLALTALSVSADAFLCGVSLARPTETSLAGGRLQSAFCVALAAFLLCFSAANCSAMFTSATIGILRPLGGILLLVPGAAGLIRYTRKLCRNVPEKVGASPRFSSFPTWTPSENVTLSVRGQELATAFSAGLAAGTDGAVATLSLIVSGYSGSAVVFFVTIGHFIAAFLGTCTAQTSAVSGFFDRYAFFPSFLLLFLGALRL